MTIECVDYSGSEGLIGTSTAGLPALQALDHRDAIRVRDPLIRLGGLTLEFVNKVVATPMALFLVAGDGQRCSLAEMRVDPILTPDPGPLQSDCAEAIAATVPDLGRPAGFRHHLLLDRDGLDQVDGFSGSPFAEQFMTAWGLGSILVLLMRQEGTGMACAVALLRSADESGFRDREKTFLRQMAPLLTQSLNCVTGEGPIDAAFPGADIADASDPGTLTRREMEIARLVAAGACNGEIAKSLSITVGTVKCHIRNIYSKLGIHSRVRLSLLLAGS